MTDGIRITGTHGNILIDSEVGINYCMTGRGTATLVRGSGSFAAAALADLVVSGQRPTLAVQGGNAQLTVMSSVNLGNGQWRFRVLGSSVNAGASFTYFVFDYPSSLSNYGVKTFSSGSVCTFDALRFPPKIMSATVRNDLPQGSYAVIVNQITSYMLPTAPAGQNYQYYVGYKTTPTGITALEISGFLWTDNITMVNSISGAVLVVDVANNFL